MTVTNNPSGKELLFSTLNHEAHKTVPWVPFAGVHAGKLKKYSAYEILTDENKLVESLLEVNRLYHPSGQPVMFDLQIEAEILGCNLVWSDEAPPSVASHPLEAVMEIPTRLPEKTDGRLPLVLNAMRRVKDAVGSHTALYGLITGPFTLASHLRGTEIFMDSFDHEDFLIDLLKYTTGVAKKMADLYLDAGMDVIAVVDPVVSQVSPRHFKKFLSSPFSDIFTHIRQRGAYSSFFVCGDATKNIEVMCQTNPDCIAVDENINMIAAKQITDRYNIVIEGNIPLTTRMLLGTQQDNMKYVVDLLDALKVDGENPYKNLILSPGCDMPYDVPVENAIGVAEAVRDPEAARLILINYQAKEIDLDAVILPDYRNLEKPLIEVFTLDSATCAACGYMLGAAQRAAEQLSGQVDLVEYKITKPENIARLMKMGIQNLPTIMINGQLKFSSIIPGNRELVDEIEKFIK